MSLASRIKAHKPASIFDHLQREVFSPDFDKPSEMAYIESGNCYEWYYAIGKHYRPATILEIGVRYGYSLSALAKGAGGDLEVEGWDIESYESSSNEHVRMVFDTYLTDAAYSIIEHDSQKERHIEADFDLIHIDGDHSFHGKVHDLMLAWMSGAKVIVVDDYDFLADVRKATDHFLKGIHPTKYRTAYLPSFRGTLVIERA